MATAPEPADAASGAIVAAAGGALRGSNRGAPGAERGVGVVRPFLAGDLYRAVGLPL